MSVLLECKKVKRTGFLPAFLGGGILAAAVPVVNMVVRSEIYQARPGDPIQILLDANWQMMAMLNVLLAVAGACLLYHIEYADNAMKKIRSLPLRESSVFMEKAVLTALVCFLVLAIEMGAVVLCVYRWFEAGQSFPGGVCQTLGYEYLLMLPCIVSALLISQMCENMWVSLGIGVVCVFTATMLPADNFILSLFPFAMPFQILAGQTTQYVYAVAAELLILGLAELIYIKIRRSAA